MIINFAITEKELSKEKLEYLFESSHLEKERERLEL
jgi:hypothetical protein